MKQTAREIFTNKNIHTANHLMPLPHIHDDIEIIYVKEGGCTAVNNGQTYQLKKNDIFFNFPNQLHYYTSYEKDSMFLICIIKPSMLLQYESIFLENTPVSAVVSPPYDKAKKLSVIVDWIVEELKNDNSDIIASYVTLFVGLALKHMEMKNRTTLSDSVSNVILYCSNHYKEDISISKVAKALHLSESYLSYIFKNNLLMNFNDYINSLRIGDAVNMLKYEDYSMSYISDTVGFGTIRTFNRAFQKIHHISPSKYKKTYKSHPNT